VELEGGAKVDQFDVGYVCVVFVHLH